jgi:hypothetical protein
MGEESWCGKWQWLGTTGLVYFWWLWKQGITFFRLFAPARAPRWARRGRRIYRTEDGRSATRFRMAGLPATACTRAALVSAPPCGFSKGKNSFWAVLLLAELFVFQLWPARERLREWKPVSAVRFDNHKCS